MHERRKLKVALASGEVRDISFSMSKEDPCFLETDEYGPRALRANGDDLFDCLVNLRGELEKDGAKILCNGARIDAYPSGMARDMARGRKVYLLRMGERARLEDLVNTFDEAPIDKLGSVADQREYYLSWIKSCQ